MWTRSAIAGLMLAAAVPFEQAASQSQGPQLYDIESEQQVIDALDPYQTRSARPTYETGKLPVRIEFEINSATLTPEERRVLDMVGRALQSDRLSDYSFRIEGHTDAAGSDGYNMQLSQRRAQAVAGYLTSNYGINPRRLTAVGRGERELLDPRNPLAEENRRVQFVTLGG